MQRLITAIAIAILMYLFLKMLINRATYNNVLVFFFTASESAASLSQSICVLKWNMTDISVLCVITRLHLAKWVNLSFLSAQNRQKPLPDSSVQPVLSIWIELCSNQTNHSLFQTGLLQTGPWVMNWKSLYLITPAAQGWRRSIWEVVRWNSNMDTLQLLTLSLSGRCAFSVLTLVVPHLLPPGSFAILLMAGTGSLFPTLHYWCIRECG